VENMIKELSLSLDRSRDLEISNTTFPLN